MDNGNDFNNNDDNFNDDKAEDFDDYVNNLNDEAEDVDDDFYINNDDVIVPGDGTAGGLYAEAGTPLGQHAKAGLGGVVDKDGNTSGENQVKIREKLRYQKG